jgi:hypothetical protein
MISTPGERCLLFLFFLFFFAKWEIPEKRRLKIGESSEREREREEKNVKVICALFADVRFIVKAAEYF